MLSPGQQILKRSFDVIFSLILLPILWIPICVLVILATFETKQWGVFTQKRIGRYAKAFTIFKIRTLYDTYREGVRQQQSGLLGKWMRRTKLDELPQLFNVLLGDMSWVGPRPDVPGYADQLVGAEAVILSVRPGIIGPASIKYRNEEIILQTQLDPQQYNDHVIWKDKVAINQEYVKNWSFARDLKYLFRLVF